MDIISAIVIAVVEGITEFLPVSSTAHLVLTAQLLNVAQSEFAKSFEIVIQLGAILAIVVLYGKRVLGNTKVWGKLIAAFIPTGVVGLVVYKTVKQVLLGNPVVAMAALVVGGLVMWWWEERGPKGSGKVEELSWGRAVVIGICQAVAVVPGVSRAMATVYGGMAMGLGRKEAVEMSFWLAVPTMAAASGWDLVNSGWAFSGGEWLALGVGFGVAFGTALLTVKWLVKHLQSGNWKRFAVYRMVVAVGWGATLI